MRQRERTEEEESAAQELQLFIGELSQRHFHADWHTGCEYVLWQCVVEPDSTGVHINVEDRMHLAILSLRAGGWWHWPDESEDIQFMRIGAWRAHYADWKNGMFVARRRVGAHYVLEHIRTQTGDWPLVDGLALLDAWIVREFGELPNKDKGA